MSVLVLVSVGCSPCALLVSVNGYCYFAVRGYCAVMPSPFFWSLVYCACLVMLCLVLLLLLWCRSAIHFHPLPQPPLLIISPSPVSPFPFSPLHPLPTHKPAYCTCSISMYKPKYAYNTCLCAYMYVCMYIDSDMRS